MAMKTLKYGYVSRMVDPGSVQLGADAYAVAQGRTLAFTITRTVDGPASTYFAGAAVAGWTINSEAVTPAAGSVSWADGEHDDKTVSVVLDDSADDFQITLTLGPSEGAELGVPALALVDVDVVQVGDISLSSDAASIDLLVGTTTTLRVLRSGPDYRRAISADYATADGTAVAGTDYVAVAGTATFGDGESADIPITLTALAAPDYYSRLAEYTLTDLWKLDDDVTTLLAVNSVRTGADFTFNAAATAGPAIRDMSASTTFDSGQYALMSPTYQESYNFRQQRTMCFWVSFNQLVAAAIIVNRAETDLDIKITADATITILVNGFSTGTILAGAELDTPYFIALVVDYSGETMAAYVNGALAYSWSGTAKASTTNSDAETLTLGRGWSGTSAQTPTLQADLAGFAYITGALSASDIAYLYAGGYPKTFSLDLSNPQGGTALAMPSLATPSSATITIDWER